MIRLMISLTLLGLAIAHSGESHAQEADDSRDYARAGYLSFEMETTLSTPEDVDWYRVPVGRSGRLIVRQPTQTPQAPALTMILEDEAGFDVELTEPINTEVGLEASALVEPGLYFLALSGTASPEPYKFELELALQTRAEAVWQAMPGIPEALGSFPIEAGQADRPLNFSLPVDEMGLFSISIDQALDATAAYGATLTNQQTKTVTQAQFFKLTLPDGKVRLIARQQIEAGNYELALFRTAGEVSAANVRFSLDGFADAFEPNNSPDRARPARLNARMTLLNLYSGDTDWFYFDLETAGQLKIIPAPVLEPRANWIAPALYLTDPQSSALENTALIDGNTYIYEVQAGHYYLNLPAYPGYEIDLELSLLFSPEDTSTDTEPSDTRFYLVGLEPEANLAATLDNIAASGAGRNVSLPSNDMDIGLTLASIVSETGDRDLSLIDYLRATSRVMSQRLVAVPSVSFKTYIFQQSDALEKSELFELRSGGEEDLAQIQADKFKTRMLRYFRPTDT